MEKRREMINYNEFQSLGYPIGSGSVESANKLVVESRLKQAGMRWARHNIDSMLGLRNIACNDRWEEAWPQIVNNKLEDATESRKQRRAFKSPNQFQLTELDAQELSNQVELQNSVNLSDEKPVKVRAKAHTNSKSSLEAKGVRQRSLPRA